VFQSSIGERRRARKETLRSLARRAAGAGRRYCFLVEQQCNQRPPLFPHLLKLDSIPSLEVDACSCARAVVSVFAGGPTIGALS
jgi:hypothetical protein